jgi:glutathione S-transferase
MLTLYYFPGNASLTPHILLNEIGTSFELALVDRSSDAQRSAAYLRLNPNGRIPTLVDDDLVIYETAAIVLHLVDRFPEANLAPL